MPKVAQPEVAASERPATGPKGPTRVGALDAVRAWAMFLGVDFHAALCFMDKDYGYCPRMDAARSICFDVFDLAVHAFRMQLFFIIAGYFGALVSARRGPAGFAANRAGRILLPLLFGGAILIPLVNLPFIQARAIDSVAAISAPAGSWRATLGASIWDFHNPRHLWFLVYLLCLSALGLAAAQLVRHRFLKPLADEAASLLACSLTSPWAPLLLAPPVIAINLFMSDWPVDTADSWAPNPVVLAYYLVFFACGWTAYSRGVDVASMGRNWPVLLGLALAVLLPLLIVVGVLSQPALHDFAAARRLPRSIAILPAVVVQSLFTWSMALGAIGVFVRFFSRPNRVVAYLADAAYWVYLSHLPIVYMLQLRFQDWAAPALVKFTAILALTLAACLVSYQLAVRRTIIGAVLNGRRAAASSAPARGGTDTPASAAHA